MKIITNEIPRLIESFEPDFIFYLSGVDIIENDKLGKLSVSLEGCKLRDNFVLNYCKNNKLPVQVSMGGGYSIEINEIVHIKYIQNSTRNIFKKIINQRLYTS